MREADAIPMDAAGAPIENPWTLPYRGTVGMACLILAESAIFIIFVVAYIFYIGKSLSGPTPAQVLELPIFGTICLLSSSITVHFAVSALHKGKLRQCAAHLAGTVLLPSGERPAAELVGMRPNAPLDRLAVRTGADITAPAPRPVAL